MLQAMLQAKGPCLEATARWIRKWKRKTGVSDGFSGSTAGSVALLRVRVESPVATQWDRYKLGFHRRHSSWPKPMASGILGLLIPFLPFPLQLSLVVSESCWVVDLLICTGRPVGWGKQPSHRTVVAQDGDRMQNFNTCL